MHMHFRPKQQRVTWEIRHWTKPNMYYFMGWQS